ncbi:MAG: phosphonate metabolism protein PhnP [Sedimenticola sp.]|nr:phosphonate metabolism protein PhnP [Sedimenticola sp.]
MPEIEFTGTGAAAQVPVWGCRCTICLRAASIASYRRRPAGLAITGEQGVTLIDAGSHHLAERYSPEQLQRVVLTHFHMDHVQALFQLRWAGGRHKIPLFRPDDPVGCDDLYKHPGIFSLQKPFQPFQQVEWPGLRLTALPLQHSRVTLGYLLQTPGTVLAYLCDTAGLPRETERFLAESPIDYLVLDCSEPPTRRPPSNHNDLNRALAIVRRLRPEQTLLTHIGHHFDNWLLEHTRQLPADVSIARDGMRIPCP